MRHQVEAAPVRGRRRRESGGDPHVVRRVQRSQLHEQGPGHRKHVLPIPDHRHLTGPVQIHRDRHAAHHRVVLDHRVRLVHHDRVVRAAPGSPPAAPSARTTARSPTPTRTRRKSAWDGAAPTAGPGRGPAPTAPQAPDRGPRPARASGAPAPASWPAASPGNPGRARAGCGGCRAPLPRWLSAIPRPPISATTNRTAPTTRKSGLLLRSTTIMITDDSAPITGSRVWSGPRRPGRRSSSEAQRACSARRAAAAR